MGIEQEREPRLYLHGDGMVVSIGFTDTPDTLLFLNRVPGEYNPEVDRDRGDMKRLREWVEAMNDVIPRSSLTQLVEELRERAGRASNPSLLLPNLAADKARAAALEVGRAYNEAADLIEQSINQGGTGR